MARIINLLHNRYTLYTATVLIIAARLKFTWLKFGHILVDTYRDQWVIHCLSIGKTLYKDIFYLYGPFPVYCLSVLYRVYGTYVPVFIFCNTLIFLLFCFILYRTSRLFLNRYISALCVVHFTIVFGLASYHRYCIFNFIVPYSAASTFYALFSITAVYFFVRYLKHEKNKYFIFWCTAMTGAFTCRPEFALLIWAAFTACASVHLIRKREPRSILRVFLPLTAAILLYAVFFSFTGSFNGFRLSLLGAINTAQTGNSTFSMNAFSSGSLSGNFIIAVKSLCFFIISLMLITASCSIKRKSVRTFSTIAIAGVICAVMSKISHTNYYRFLPLLLGAGCIIHILNRQSRVMIIASVGLVSLIRILFNVHPSFYSFFLIPCGLVYLYFFSFAWFCDNAEKLLKTFSPALYKTAVAVVFITCIVSSYSSSEPYITKKTKLFSLPGLTEFYYYGLPDETAVISTVNWLRNNTKKTDTLVCFPEGIAFNFLSGRFNPTPYHTYLPDQALKITDDIMIQQLQKHKVDYILLHTRDVTEYGSRGFGKDYGIKLTEWISDNYTLHKTLTAGNRNNNNSFSIKIFRKSKEQF